MNPIIAGIINLVPAIINTAGNIIKDKKKAKDETTRILPPFVEDAHNIADGLDVSSKTVVGYGIGGVIVMYALNSDLTNKYNLIILGIGALVVIGTTVAKALEK